MYTILQTFVKKKLTIYLRIEFFKFLLGIFKSREYIFKAGLGKAILRKSLCLSAYLYAIVAKNFVISA